MNSVAKAGLGIVGAVVGLPVGALTVFYLIVIFGRVVFGREFYQIAWLILGLGILTGAWLGAVFGAQMAVMWPRGFALTFLPLAVLLLVVEVAQYQFRRMERPRLFTVMLTTGIPRLDMPVPRGRADGRGFIGRITTDGELHEIEGTIPATLTYTAIRMEYHMELTDGQDNEWYTIRITTDDQVVSEISTDFAVSGDIWTLGIGWWNRTGGSVGVKLRSMHQKEN